jgi:acyl-CoA thioesterase-1
MSPNNKYSVSYLMCATAGLVALAMLPARAQMLGAHPAASAAAVAVSQSAVPAPACSAPAELARFSHPLRHTARRLANGGPLVIVAIGSSSTNGAGASSPAASYPSRLAVELKQRFPGRDITVLNRGVNG